MKRILVLDDSAINVRFMLSACRDDNHTTDSFTSPVDAMTFIEKHKPDYDIVFSDFNLCNPIDGEMFMIWLRPFQKLTTVYVLTTASTHGLKSRADIVLHKPFVKQDITDILDKL